MSTKNKRPIVIHHPTPQSWYGVLGKRIVSLRECKDVDQNTDDRDLYIQLCDVIDVV